MREILVSYLGKDSWAVFGVGESCGGNIVAMVWREDGYVSRVLAVSASRC